MPGQAGEIRWQNTKVFHARFLDRRLPPLKWRAAALAESDGWRWDSSRAREGRTLRPADGRVRLADGEQLWLAGRLFICDVYLNTTSSEWLFIADTPEDLRVSTPLVLEPAATGYRAPPAGPDDFRSVVHSTAGPPQPAAAPPPGERKFDLRLPVVDAGVIELAHGIPERACSVRERARRIKVCRLAGCKDSLRTLEHVVNDPLAWLLFGERNVQWEHFASAMAVLLRAVPVPARFTVGFREGNDNSLTGWHVVRASDGQSGGGPDRRPRVVGTPGDASRSCTASGKPARPAHPLDRRAGQLLSGLGA